LTAVASWKLTFANPCNNPGFVAITGNEDSTQILGNYESIDIVYDYIP